MAKAVTGVSAISSFSTLVVGGIGVILIVVGGRSIVSGSMTLGDFVMYIFFTGLVARPLIDISQIGTQISEAFAGLDRIREIRRMLTEQDEDASREPMDGVEGEIAFEEVWFEYDEDVPVLKGVSFLAASGTTTALVGSSGSGKSTLISLVMAFNGPSFERFEPLMESDGLMMYNSSLISNEPQRDDLEYLAVPATELADELGDGRVANLVMLGAYLAHTGMFEESDVDDALDEVIKYKEMLELDRRAVARGFQFIEEME